MHAFRRDIGVGDRAIVAEDLEREQAVVEAGAPRPAREQRRGGGIEHHEVRLLPRLEPADPVGQSNHARAAGGREMKRAERIEAGAAKLGDLVRLAIVASSEKLVPAPTSVARPTATP